MIRLLVHRAIDRPGTHGTVFGGSPLVARGASGAWPRCRECGGAMQFLGRIQPDAAATRVVQVFMCQNDPGCCEEWDANAGGNAAQVLDAEATEALPAPEEGEVLRPATYGADVVEIDAADYDAARDAWIEATGRSPRHVLGQLGGTPMWLQGEETPDCECCEVPMRFLALLEQGPDWETEMNFGGGGVGYAFVCANDQPTAKFLWQC